MTPIDYKALAERLKAHAECHSNVEPYDDEQRQWADDLRTVVSLLDGMADATPIHAYEWDTYDGAVRRSFSPAPYNGREPARTLMLYLHPAPQPQPEPIDPHMIVAEDRFPEGLPQKLVETMRDMADERQPVSEQGEGGQREASDLDAVLRLLGLNPDECRTEGGSLMLQRVRERLPTEAQIVAVANVLLAWEAEVSDRVPARVLAEDVIRAALAARETK